MTKHTPSEREIQNAILEYLRMRGVFCWRQNTGSFPMEHKSKRRFFRAAFPGMADIIAIQWRGGSGIGQFIAIEVKSAEGTQSEDQRAFQVAVERSGGLYILARSVEDVARVFEQGGFSDTAISAADIFTTTFERT